MINVYTRIDGEMATIQVGTDDVEEAIRVVAEDVITHGAVLASVPRRRKAALALPSFRASVDDAFMAIARRFDLPRQGGTFGSPMGRYGSPAFS